MTREYSRVTRHDYSVDTNGIRLHVIELLPDTAAENIPLVFIPGMTTPADYFAEALVPAFPRRCIIISIRGRGRSEAPLHGYSVQHQASDIAAVTNYFGLERYALYGHSVGAVFALVHALQFPQSVQALVLGDYPPVYPAFGTAWMQRVLDMPELSMQEIAVRGVVREAERCSLAERLGELRCPVLVLKGALPDSLLSDAGCELYQQYLPTCRISTLHRAGHDLLHPEASAFVDTVEGFLRTCV